MFPWIRHSFEAELQDSKSTGMYVDDKQQLKESSKNYIQQHSSLEVIISSYYLFDSIYFEWVLMYRVTGKI